MSILDQSIRSLDSCDEALEQSANGELEDTLHRVCSRDTLDDSDEIINENPVCYSTENLLSSSSSVQLRQFKSNLVAITDGDAEDTDGLPDYGSREKMMSYEVNCFSDSEDDDDVYEPDWKVYEEFRGGVLEDQQNDVLPIHESQWMKSTDKLAMDAVASDWDMSRRMGRKRHYRLGQMSSDLEELVKQLDVIPAKIRRLNEDGGGRGTMRED